MKTQHEKILEVMSTDPGRWWLPHDFMQPDLAENFVGYEASARLSELAKMGKLESKRDGKYIARRLITQVTNKPVRAPVVDDLDDGAPTTKKEFVFKDRSFARGDYQPGTIYELTMAALRVGQPIKVLAPFARTYNDLASFSKEWSALA